MVAQLLSDAVMHEYVAASHGAQAETRKLLRTMRAVINFVKVLLWKAMHTFDVLGQLSRIGHHKT